MKNTNLDSNHYASDWELPTELKVNDLQVVNQAGIVYSNSSNGPDKQAALLQILQWYHGYVMKYVDMIVRGHLHTYKNKVSKDSRALLKYFISKDEPITTESLTKAVKNLHLAFQGQTATEIYNILIVLLIRAINKYDAKYSEKIHVVVKILNKFPKKKLFTINRIKKRINFDPASQLKVLARHEYIVVVKNKKNRVAGYKIKNWPPKKSFLDSGPIGFSYVVQMWFRYYLRDYIDNQMQTLEARAWDKTVQLGHGHNPESDLDTYMDEGSIPHAHGQVTDDKGQNWAADTSLMNSSLDISVMSLEWVESTDDKLFRNMTKLERRILYMYYVSELTWKQISAKLGMSLNQLQNIHNGILEYLKSRFKAK